MGQCQSNNGRDSFVSVTCEPVTSKRQLASIGGQAAKKKRLQEAAEVRAAIVLQTYARGNAGRRLAATTCPPCAAACPKYAIDMNAEVFGSCIRCGFLKAGHTERALSKAEGSTKLKKRGDPPSCAPR